MRETLHIDKNEPLLRAGDLFQFAIFGTFAIITGDGRITRKGNVQLVFDNAPPSKRVQQFPIRTFKRKYRRNLDDPSIHIWRN